MGIKQKKQRTATDEGKATQHGDGSSRRNARRKAGRKSAAEDGKSVNLAGVLMFEEGKWRLATAIYVRQS